MGYIYEELIYGLDIGSEIEFIYKDRKYYIGRGTGKYRFWAFDDPDNEIVGETTEDILSKVKIDGKSIKDLWNGIEIDVFY